MKKVMVLHGLGAPIWSMAFVCARLRFIGYDVYPIGYPSRKTTLEEMVAIVRGRLPKLPSGDAINFVGHSLGGHVAKRLVEKNGMDRPGRMVMVGTPLRGNAMAGFIGRNIPDVLGYGPIYRDLSPEKHIAHDKIIDGCEIGMIAGQIPVLPWLVNLASDGLVDVASTRAGCLKDHVVVPGSHLTLLLSCKVVEYCDRFLKTGSFSEKRP